MRPEWFPNWSDSICVIIGAGESVVREDIDELRGQTRVIAVNRSHELAPWADALYAADRRFWDVFAGVREFAGLKVTPDLDAARHFHLHLVGLLDLGSPLENSLSEVPGVLARGGHSGHQALNLSVQFGAKRIVLMGLDFIGEHWHGRHPSPLRNSKEATMVKWSERLDALAPMLKSLGVEVINCSQISRLTNYPRMSVREVLAKWSGTSS